MQYNGIDVSEVQGNIDWGSVASAGIKFAMIRATYGASGVDNQFAKNMDGISGTNISPGVYHRSGAQNISEAEEEANHFLNIIRTYNFYYPLALVVESGIAMRMGKGFFTNIISTFLDVIKKSKYYPILYAGVSMIKDYVDTNQISNTDIWLSDFTADPAMHRPTYDENVTIWQYSNRGSVQGVSGNANLNISYVDYPMLIKQEGLNHLNSDMNNNNNNNNNNNFNNVNNSGINGNTYGNGNSNNNYMKESGNGFGSSMNAGNGTNIAAKATNSGDNTNNMNNTSNINSTNNMNKLSPGYNSTRVSRLEPDFSEPSFYTVEKNDTLRSIAKKVFGDPEQYKRLMELNGLTRPIIFAGQTLRIPQDINSNIILYRVKQDDTLWKIAERFLGNGPRYEEIMILNGLTTDMVYPGQVVKIPADQKVFFQTYTVKKGDTLWRIAKNFLGNGNRYLEIMSLNKLKNGNLRIGQSLKIPAR